MQAADLIKFISRAIAPIKRKIALTVGRGLLLAIKDSEGLQQVQLTLLADEVKDQVELMGHFGFTSNSPIGSEAVMLSVGGNREHGIIIATEHRDKRLKDVASGDSATYNGNGKYVWLKGDDIELLLSKFKVENDSHELMVVLVEWMEKVIEGETLTAIGPQPWTPETVVLLEEVKAKLETFKKD